MKRSAVLVAASILLATPGVAGAITNGSVISVASANAIVLILIGGSGVCSGTLIAPTVVLTAAHCVEDPMAGNYLVYGGTQPGQTALFAIGASEVHAHPNFDVSPPVHDVGVLILDSPAPVAPLPWLSTDAGSYTLGSPVALFGFGVTGPNASDDGYRRGGTSTIASVTAGEFITGSPGTAAACYGDSGGPAISNFTVIGVNSYGDQNCAEFSVFDRTDDNADFISLFAPEPGADAEVALAFGALVLLARPRA